MAGFFESRWNPIKSGGYRTVKGCYRFFHQTFGWRTLPEGRPGLIGGVIDIARAGLNGLFSRDRGLLNPIQGWKLAPWKRESMYNPLRHTRKAVAAVLNTGAMATAKILGLPSAEAEAFFYRLLTGVGSLPGAAIGDYSEYMGERRTSSVQSVSSFPSVIPNAPQVGANTMSQPPAANTPPLAGATAA